MVTQSIKKLHINQKQHHACHCITFHLSEMKIVVRRINVKTLLNILKASIALVSFMSLYFLLSVSSNPESAEMLQEDVSLTELETRKQQTR